MNKWDKEEVTMSYYDDLVQSYIDGIEDKKRCIVELMKNGQFPDALNECDNFLRKVNDIDNKFWGLKHKQIIAYKIAKTYNLSDGVSDETRKQRFYYVNMTLECLNDMLSLYPNPHPWIYCNKAVVLSDPVYGIQETFEARRLAIAAMESENVNDKKGAIQVFRDLNEEVLEYFNSCKFSNQDCIPFSDRQFIMFAKSDDKMAGYYDPDDNIKWVFSVNNYPNDIKIEGLPQPNILYMANPVKKDTYLPYENAEEILFQSKVREFEYLVGCLGATSIRFRSLKGKKVSSEREVDRSAGAEVDVKAVGGGLNVNWGSKENRNTSTSSELGRNQKLNPTKYPFIPEGLGWYNLVEEWRDFARQRLQNGLTHYHYIFKSSESSSLSTQKKLDISSSFKKMALSINAHYSQNIKESIAIQEETEWEVEVDFKPLEEFANQSGNAKKSGFAEIPVSNVTLNDNEQFYYDELQDVLADGVITENDRKRLERRRQRLNISEERAKEIEQMLSPSLTDDEQEYYDELFEVLDDGVIDDKERRSLDRLKRSLGISDSRAKEIEDMAFAKRGLK